MEYNYSPKTHNQMKKLMFLICFIFAFISFSFAKSEISKSEKASYLLVLGGFGFSHPTTVREQPPSIERADPNYYYKRYSKSVDYVDFIPKPKYVIPKAGKPCKIPIPLQIRNKDNI